MGEDKGITWEWGCWWRMAAGAGHEDLFPPLAQSLGWLRGRVAKRLWRALLLSDALRWVHLSIPEALVTGPENSASVRTTQHVSSLPPSNPSSSAGLHGAFALRRLATVSRISGWQSISALCSACTAATTMPICNFLELRDAFSAHKGSGGSDSLIFFFFLPFGLVTRNQLLRSVIFWQWLFKKLQEEYRREIPGQTKVRHKLKRANEGSTFVFSLLFFLSPWA